MFPAAFRTKALVASSLLILLSACGKHGGGGGGGDDPKDPLNPAAPTDPSCPAGPGPGDDAKPGDTPLASDELLAKYKEAKRETTYDADGKVQRLVERSGETETQTWFDVGTGKVKTKTVETSTRSGDVRTDVTETFDGDGKSLSYDKDVTTYKDKRVAESLSYGPGDQLKRKETNEYAGGRLVKEVIERYTAGTVTETVTHTWTRDASGREVTFEESKLAPGGTAVVSESRKADYAAGTIERIELTYAGTTKRTVVTFDPKEPVTPEFADIGERLTKTITLDNKDVTKLTRSCDGNTDPRTCTVSGRQDGKAYSQVETSKRFASYFSPTPYWHDLTTATTIEGKTTSWTYEYNAQGAVVRSELKGAFGSSVTTTTYDDTGINELERITTSDGKVVTRTVSEY